MGIGRGFVSGLAQGVALGNTVMDTYDRYKLKGELENAGKLDQETIAGKLNEYDQSTADFVNNPDSGYEVQKLANGGLKYRTAGSDNNWQELSATGAKYKLGNKVQDTEFTADQITKARADAQANVYMQNGDPMKGYGLKSLAREERKGQQWEDINQNQINDLQALAEGKYDQLRGTIDKGVERYNNAQTGQYADGHRISVDWNKNEAIVTGPKNEVVRTIPITQQTAAQFIRSYYDDLRSAANPEFGLKAREVNAREKSAQADVDYKGAGGVAERVGMANVKMHQSAIGAMNPAQAYALEQTKRFDAAKNDVIAELEAGKITEQAAVKKIGLLGMKFGQGAGSGLGKADEAQVEYDPETGQKKIKGTVSQVAAYERTDPKTKAATGDLSVTQPTKNQTGVETPRDAQRAEAKPDLSKWTMKPAGKTMWGETDYVLEGPSGRMTLGDFIKRYGYNPSAEFIGRR